MPSDYYTSYIPRITATPKEDFIPIGSTNRNQAGGKKLLPTSRIVLYIAEAMKSRTIPFVLVWFCFMLFNLSDAWAQSADSRAAEGQTEIKPLVPGQPIPEEIWNTTFTLHYFDGSTKEVKFSDFRGKAILLDFWSTGCVSCIQGIPKMERYQRQYKDDLIVLLVNSKRNKDTPERIANRFKVYKKVNKYVPELPTILDDTVFTALLPHNTIPNISWINQDGIYLANTMSGLVSDKQLEEVVKTGNANLIHNGVLKNRGRRTETPPLVDTAGVTSISLFASYMPRYLSVYPNLVHKNGTSFYQFVNQDFSMVLFFAFGEELNGFGWNDYVFEADLKEKLRDKALFWARNADMYSYQFYHRDSVDRATVQRILREDLAREFGFSVKRQTGAVDIYKLELTDGISSIKAGNEIGSVDIQSADHPVTYVNTPMSIVAGNLFYWLDRPLIIDDATIEKIDELSVNLTIPANFDKLTLDNRLVYLEEQGIKLIPTRLNKEYPVFIQNPIIDTK